jgi:PAS domain S-box-containing protein
MVWWKKGDNEEAKSPPSPGYHTKRHRGQNELTSPGKLCNIRLKGKLAEILAGFPKPDHAELVLVTPVDIGFFLMKSQRNPRKKNSSRRRGLACLKECRERYLALFDRTLYCVYVHDFRGRFLDANQAALNLLGYSREELPQITFSSIMDPDQLPKAFRLLDEIRRTGFQKKPIEFRLRRKDGSPVWVETEASVVSSDGDSLVIQGIARDITDHKRAEAKLRTSLEEKEVLLREIHHRVKNNLQVISSLLDLRTLRSEDEKTVDLCRDARAKIHTMALIHSHIYQNETFTQIAMKDYIRDLVSYLSQVYSEKRQQVRPVIRESEVFLSVTQAIPLAIVLNEAITNAFKHAFKKGQKGRIDISLKRQDEDTAYLTVQDNGAGLPPGLDVDRTETLGLKLMRNLVKDQLQGSIRLKRNRGTTLVVEFKILKEGKNGENSGC